MVYAVRGDTGEALANFPVSLGRAAQVHTPLRMFFYGLSRSVLVAACTDGYLAFIALPTACLDRIDLAQPLGAAFYLGDFSQRGGLELLVPSAAGQAYLVATDAVFHPVQAWHGRAKGSGVHHAAAGWLGAYFAAANLGGERLMEQEISGRDIVIKIDIVDERKQTLQGRSYAVRVQLDSKVLLDRTYSAPGRYEESVALDEGTERGAHMLTLRMRNELGQECGDAMYVTVEPRTERVVRWLVLLPLVALFLLLMLVREAPDLLPQ